MNISSYLYMVCFIFQRIRWIVIVLICFLNGPMENHSPRHHSIHQSNSKSIEKLNKTPNIKTDDPLEIIEEEEALYEKQIQEPVYETPFPFGFIPDGLENPSVVTTLSEEQILLDINTLIEKMHPNGLPQFPNHEMERLYRFFLTYDRISEIRYRRTVFQLGCQKNKKKLIEFIKKTRWYKEFLIPISSKPIYDYSEVTALRILISAHTAAHFFRIPYTTLICLIFQESKFDFKIRSYTGAIGLGQITKIALLQIKKLRENPNEERRIQAAAAHIKNIYEDPVFDGVLRNMGFYPMFPRLGTFPDHIDKFSPYKKKIILEVKQELLEKGFSFAKNDWLVRKLIKKDLSGHVLTNDYAAVHPALLKVTERNYGKKYGCVLNIETNILVASMLLWHYMNYSWKIDKKKIHLKPCVASIMAVAAYNQGPLIVSEFLRHIHKKYPNFNIEKANPKDFDQLFTKHHFSKALKHKRLRAEELFMHVREIRKCSEFN